MNGYFKQLVNRASGKPETKPIEPAIRNWPFYGLEGQADPFEEVAPASPLPSPELSNFARIRHTRSEDQEPRGILSAKDPLSDNWYPEKAPTVSVLPSMGGLPGFPKVIDHSTKPTPAKSAATEKNRGFKQSSSDQPPPHNLSKEIRDPIESPRWASEQPPQSNINDFSVNFRHSIEPLSGRDKAVSELHPTPPIVSAPPPFQKSGQRLVIGRLTVEVVQPSPMDKKAPLVRNTPRPAKPQPKSQDSGSQIKSRFGLGQM